MRTFFPTLLLPTALLLAACTAAAPPAPAPAPAPATTAAALCNGTRWVARSAEYEAAAHQAFTLATERVEELAAGRAPGTWAVALDGDETVISNLTYQLEGERLGVGHTSARWAEWVERRQATAMPGAVAFLQRVRELGGRIAIVTNRHVSAQRATEDNLDALGVPYDVVLSMDRDREKEPRYDAVAEGTADPGLPPLDIVLWVGDNIMDFPDLDQGLKGGDAAAFADFGRRFILIPNPLYGSWEAGD